jgi:hypothetical protein
MQNTSKNPKKVFKIQDLKIETFSMRDLAKVRGAVGGSGRYTKDTKTRDCGCHANDNT